MSTETRFQTHERLMTRMADANGVDLELRLQTGEISPDFYEHAVLNCTGCSDAEGCRAHLAEGREGFPGFCRNQDALARLSGTSPTPD